MSPTQEKQKINEADMYAEGINKGEEKIILVFGLNEENFGLDVQDIREIVRVPPTITRVPNAPSHIKGVINLRGTIVPVLDVSMRIGEGSNEETSESRIIVVEYSDVLFGILVDDVKEVNTIYESQIEQVSDLDSAVDQEFMRGVAKMEDGRLIVLLDLPALFQIEGLVEDEGRE
ncbi:CheW protein [Dethiosulfovibrio peptidovorans DSM 11002]|uniref:CheW protein n=1 Tax=Dethiosulfovibrio peptidovorans DSM 11002 TaxID=469381 RepID=D2Z4G9_9BACT|nr:chemotaxis protein CheW [Dethiosulfovibrio peptidovorans]EFC90498.1 CheW protein [Dethiosulfovibrio peptidovorans DSM 11002]